MRRKIFISLVMLSLILNVGCARNSKKITNISIADSADSAKNYQENFNEDDRTWDITFDELDNSLKKEFHINKGDMLTVEGKMQSGFIRIYITQEGLDKEDKDILSVPLHGDIVKYTVHEWWDINKKLILELSPKNAKKGEVKIKLTNQ